MKKVLFTATVDSHILHFHLPYLKLFKENGYEVHVATNGNEKIPYTDVKHKVTFERSPYKVNNLKAIKQLKKIIDDENFDIIHCHTPMGSVVTRIAAKKARKKGTRVIYTAHGFHFYKGAPLLNWLLFYPVEKWLSRYTDTLITINNEDFEFAKRKFKKTNVEYIPGVGIDPNKFDVKMTEKEKNEIRKELGLKNDDFVMIYPAEISKRKRQMWLVNTIKDLLHENKDIHLLLPGKDSLNGECHKLVKELNLDKQIHLLGYRKDIPKLLKISNIAVSSACQEGLPVNLLEAMYVGLPIVASNCRGNNDLIENGKNGYLIDINDEEGFCRHIEEVKNGFSNTDGGSELYKLQTCLYIYCKLIGINYIHSESIDKNNKISIIVPVYNVEKYLENNIKSIVNQTYKNIEIIYVNDGSTDRSSEILEQYSLKDKRIKVIEQKNLGVSAARNNGIKEATGKYIMFVDSDDWIDITACEELITIANLYQTDYIYTNYIKEYYQKSITNKIMNYNKLILTHTGKNENLKLARRVCAMINEELINPSKNDNFSPVCMRLFSTEIIKNNKLKFVDLKEIGTSEDTLFNFQYLLHTEKAIYYNVEFYHYVRNNYSSITRSTGMELINKYEKLYKKLYIEMEKNNLSNDFYLALENRKALSIICIGLNVEKSKVSLKDKVKNLKSLLNDKRIAIPISNLNIKNMQIHWKFFFYLCKKKQTIAILLLLKIMNKITLKK